MPELTPADVQTFTGGRLLASNPQVGLMLKAALVLARRRAGWHVNPVRTDTINLDGPDSRILYLPTRKLIELTSIEENGVSLNLNALSVSVGGAPGFSEQVRVRKKSRSYWTCEYDGIEVVMEHGYTDDEAADWRNAVLMMVDQIALVTATPDGGTLTRKQIDDVAYTYQSYLTIGSDALYSMDTVFCDYELRAVEFI